MTPESKATTEQSAGRHQQELPVKRDSAAQERRRAAIRRIDAVMEERAHQKDRAFGELLEELRRRDPADT